MNSSGSPSPVSSTCSVTPSSVTIAGMASSPPSLWKPAYLLYRRRAHDVLVRSSRRGGGVAVGQRPQDLVVLARRLGVAAPHPGPWVQRRPQQPHQRHQQRAAGVLIDREVKPPVQVRVAGIVVGQGAHLVVQVPQPAQAGRVDPARGQRRAERLERGADLEVLLDPAVVGRDHGEPAVSVADQQPLGLQPPHRLADRCLADAEALGEVALAQLPARRQLSGDDLLADQRGDQVRLADVAGVPGPLGGHADALDRAQASARRRTRAGVSGSWPTLPARPSASRTAFATAPPAALTPPSPAPITPSGFPGAGASWDSSTSTAGTSAAVGIRYSTNVTACGWPASS